MSKEHDSAINATLQIIFGVASILSMIVALLGLYHQDALVFVLYRRLRNDRTESMAPYYCHIIYVFTKCGSCIWNRR